MECEYCGESIKELPFTCNWCGEKHCGGCRLPENHVCIGLQQFNKKTLLRGFRNKTERGELIHGVNTRSEYEKYLVNRSDKQSVLRKAVSAIKGVFGWK